jgi:hypothetical protein
MDFLLYNRYQRPGKALAKCSFSAGNLTFPRAICTYKPYAICHRRLLRRHGAPPLAALSPHVATFRPLLRLLPAPIRSHVFSSSWPTFFDLHTPRIGSIRRVSGPYRPAPGFRFDTTHSHTTLALPARFPFGPFLSPSPTSHLGSMLPRVLAPEETMLDFAPLPRRYFPPNTVRLQKLTP